VPGRWRSGVRDLHLGWVAGGVWGVILLRKQLEGDIRMTTPQFELLARLHRHPAGETPDCQRGFGGAGAMHRRDE